MTEIVGIIICIGILFWALFELDRTVNYHKKKRRN